MPDQLDVKGRVVAVGLNRLQVQQRQSDCVPDNLQVGLLLGIELDDLEPVDALHPLAIEPQRAVYPGGAEIVQVLIERHSVMAVVALGGCRDRRQRKAGEDEFAGQRVEVGACERRRGGQQAAKGRGGANHEQAHHSSIRRADPHRPANLRLRALGS